jgi:CSLREA domain-containing protein
MQHRHLLPLLLPLLVLAACAEQEPPSAPAETGGLASDHTPGHKLVNSLADPGNGPCNATQCTLREAINDPQSTEITFAPALTGIIMLAQPAAGGGTLVIEKTLSITGPRPAIEIRRLRTDPAFRIFRIGSGVTVTLRNLTIRNGKDNPGAGILNVGTLRLVHCTVAGSVGVGIFNQNHTLTLTRSTVEHNGGAGIFNQGGTLALTHSTVAYNSGRGGGIISEGGTATLSHVRITGNSAGGRPGGGIEAWDSRVTLTHSTIARNSSGGLGGGIANQEGSTFTLTNSTVSGNSAPGHGGGIANTFGASLTLTNSTVSGNSAQFGGGISNGDFGGGANLTLTNSTVARNSATEEGGGISLSGDESFAVLTNSLVAQNSAPTGTGPDVLHSGGVVGARFSLIGDGSGTGITNTDGNQVGNVPPNTSPINPRLGPLALNGGPTRTHALLLGSPAIDAASTPDCPSTDQRGVARPQGAGCDIGSFERE